MGLGSAAQHPLQRWAQALQRRPCSLHTPQILVALPVTLWTPHAHTQGKRPRGLAVRWPSPGPSPPQGSRSQSCEAKKALKEPARQPGLHPFSQAAQWKPAPEVLGLAPQAKWVFHVVFQGEGQVLPSGRACQHQLWRAFAQMHATLHVHGFCLDLGLPSSALGNGSQPFRRSEQQWQLLPAEASPP